jgi:phosphonate transport system substrate-binding protein
MIQSLNVARAVHGGLGNGKRRCADRPVATRPADMKFFRAAWVPFFAALLCLGLSGCKFGNASDTWPMVLHFAFSPQMEELQGGSLRIEGMRDYLQAQLHMPVEIVRVDSYAATIEAMRADKVDIAMYGGLSYILASQKAGAEAIIARGFPGGEIGGYHSVIAVPKDSPIQSMANLKAHAKDVVFDFADPASTSGYLYPRVGLMSTGIDPDTDFKKVVFAGNHLAAALTIVSGKVDAGAFMEPILTRLIELRKMAPGDVRIIWRSELIPNSCIAVHKDLPEKLKHEIQAALLEIPQKDPTVWADWMQTFRTPSSGTINVAVNDATYNGLRKYAAQVKDFKIGEN